MGTWGNIVRKDLKPLFEDSAKLQWFGLTVVHEWTVKMAVFRATVLMMEAASAPEMLVNFYQTTRRNNPEDSRLQTI
jgi:hypothetical protein